MMLSQVKYVNEFNRLITIQLTELSKLGLLNGVVPH